MWVDHFWFIWSKLALYFLLASWFSWLRRSVKKAFSVPAKMYRLYHLHGIGTKDLSITCLQASYLGFHQHCHYSFLTADVWSARHTLWEAQLGWQPFMNIGLCRCIERAYTDCPAPAAKGCIHPEPSSACFEELLFHSLQRRAILAGIGKGRTLLLETSSLPSIRLVNQSRQRINSMHTLHVVCSW